MDLLLSNTLPLLRILKTYLMSRLRYLNTQIKTGMSISLLYTDLRHRWGLKALLPT